MIIVLFGSKRIVGVRVVEGVHLKTCLLGRIFFGTFILKNQEVFVKFLAEVGRNILLRIL